MCIPTLKHPPELEELEEPHPRGAAGRVGAGENRPGWLRGGI